MRQPRASNHAVKFPLRFRTDTLSRLSDVAAAALMFGLTDPADLLPLGVFQADAHAWGSTRFAWAAGQVAAEIAAAPGITVDAGGLAVVWEVAAAELPHGPGPARGWGRKIGATQASWVRELVRVLGAKMTPSSREALIAGVNETSDRKLARVAPPRPRPRGDPFEAGLALAKQTERQLRAEFAGVDDLGDKPSPADRRCYVNIVGAGFTEEQVIDALLGRADKCRRQRRWKDLDTVQTFLRLSWLCAEVRRFVESEQVGASLAQDTTGIVVGEGGRKFVGGREVYE